MTTVKIEKGATAALNIDTSEKRRLMVGLSWDPVDPQWLEDTSKPDWVPEATGNQAADAVLRLPYYLYDVSRSFMFMQHIRTAEKAEDGKAREKDYSRFDLDLMCFVLDQNGNDVAFSGPSSEDVIDKEEVIYHSGDSYSGIGGHDDEQIHIETDHIPAEYNNFVFVVSSDCKFKLQDVKNPAIRLVDCRTEENMLELPIKPPVDTNAYHYIFGSLYKNEGNWYFRHIDQYANESTDIKDLIKSLLSL